MAVHDTGVAGVRSLVIDTDTASDDAIALLLALRHPVVSVRAITVVAGNVSLDQAVRNALVTLDVGGSASVPVYAGCAKPLVRELATAHDVHGSDGMGGVPLGEPSRAADSGHAVEVLLAIARDEPGRHALVTLGPLTNVAAALAIQPDLLTRFTSTSLMLGAIDGHGNVTPTAEYNAWVDPEAAQIVMAAPGQKTMIGWDISRRYAVITREDDERLRTAGRLGRFASDISALAREFATTLRGAPGYDLPDPIAMAVALDEALVVSSSDLHVAVSLDTSTRGQTYADRRMPLAPANVRVITEADDLGFRTMLFDLLADADPGPMV